MSTQTIPVRRLHAGASQLSGALLLIVLFVVAGAGVGNAQIALPHFAAGGGFVTGFYVVNTAGQTAGYSISFRDDSGKPVALSFTGLGSRTTLSDTVPANGSKYYEADGPTGTLLSGSGMITADSGINIQALFRRRGTGADYSEVAVPTAAGSTQFTVPFDDTTFTENGAQISTGLALVNMDAQQVARITCTARGEQGTVIANAVSVPALNPLGHWSDSQFPALSLKRGTLDCVSNTNVGSVALRFMGTTMSSLPVVANASSVQGGPQVLPHFAVGGGFTTGFYVVNTSGQSAAYGLTFYDDSGQRVALAVAGMGSGETINGNLPAHGARYFEADSPTGVLLSGAVFIAREAAITVQAVFRRRGAAGDYSEAAIPASAGATHFSFPFDDGVFAGNGSQIYTGLGLANMDVVPAHVNCTARDAQGALIPNAVSVPELPPFGHWSSSDFGPLLGKRGTLACTSDIKIAPVALRFLGNAMSSLPTIISDTAAPSGPDPTPTPGPSSGLKEFRNDKFSFQYPASLSIMSNGPDPSNRGMTLIQLGAADGSIMEVRYASHQPTEVGWAGLSARLTGEFNRTRMRAAFLDWQYPKETSESGAVVTELWTNDIRNRNNEVIGTGIWAHFDFAHIAYGYDRTRASRSARDDVFRSLTFATAPSLLGRWKDAGLDLSFNPGTTVDMTLGLGNVNDYHTTGQYTATNNSLEIAFQFVGTPMKWQCGYSMTLGHLHLDCGTAGSHVLTTEPDLEDFGAPSDY